MNDDEQVLWVGTPARIRVLDKVGRIWLVFAAFYAVVCATSVLYALLTDNRNTLIMTCVYIVCGAIVVAAAFVQLRAGRRSAHYLVTDQRIVATSKWFGQDKVQSVPLTDLGPPLVSMTDGLGTIRFDGGPSAIEAMNKAVSSFGQKVPLVLWDLEDAQRVRDIIATAQGGSR